MPERTLHAPMGMGLRGVILDRTVTVRFTERPAIRVTIEGPQHVVDSAKLVEERNVVVLRLQTTPTTARESARADAQPASTGPASAGAAQENTEPLTVTVDAPRSYRLVCYMGREATTEVAEENSVLSVRFTKGSGTYEVVPRHSRS
ncbi:MAG TPA: hypothetical protein VIL71_10960 [Spirillospora sp.]